MLVADDLFLVALDDRTGRSRLHARAMGLGLAGGLLAELVLSGTITVESGRFLFSRQSPRHHPPDPLTARTLDQLLREPQHDLRVWLAYLARDAVEPVAERLIRAGVITRERQRGLLRTTVSYLPVDATVVAWRAVRLAQLVVRREEMSWPDRVLAGLVSATDLARQVLWDAEPSAFAHLEHVVGTLPAPLRAIVAQVEALVGDSVLTHRR